MQDTPLVMTDARQAKQQQPITIVLFPLPLSSHYHQSYSIHHHQPLWSFFRAIVYSSIRSIELSILQTRIHLIATNMSSSTILKRGCSCIQFQRNRMGFWTVGGRNHRVSAAEAIRAASTTATNDSARSHSTADAALTPEALFVAVAAAAAALLGATNAGLLDDDKKYNKTSSPNDKNLMTIQQQQPSEFSVCGADYTHPKILLSGALNHNGNETFSRFLESSPTTLLYNRTQAEPRPSNSSSSNVKTSRRHSLNVMLTRMRSVSGRGLNEKYNVDWKTVLGEGAFGAVHPARLALTGEKVQ